MNVDHVTKITSITLTQYEVKTITDCLEHRKDQEEAGLLFKQFSDLYAKLCGYPLGQK